MGEQNDLVKSGTETARKGCIYSVIALVVIVILSATGLWGYVLAIAALVCMIAGAGFIIGIVNDWRKRSITDKSSTANLIEHEEGSRLIEPPPPEPVRAARAVRYCGNCGSEQKASLKFCIECGSALEGMAAEG